MPINKIKPLANPILWAILIFTLIPESRACSGYKITRGHKTLFGSNYDAWFKTPHIWFETATHYKYDAAFTGARWDGENGYAPQSGMNEKGLAFERLASYHPKQKKVVERKIISNPTQYLKDILHHCQTVEEVREYINQYDYSYFIEDMFIYVDRSGKYLIVEPYQMTIGYNQTFLVSNFCPSITSEQSALKIDRYRKGFQTLQKGFDTTLDFCIALSDTMHVCRKKIGDGTLLTTIWDLEKGMVNLYFYHNYKSTVQFNLSQEFKKGDHHLAIETLFPKNDEFEKLCSFKTPKDNALMGGFIIASAVFFLLTSIFFPIQYFRRKENKSYSYFLLWMFPLQLSLCYYMYVLSGPVNIFYFSAPYKDPTHLLISLSSYIPFILLLLIVPFLVVNLRMIKQSNWGILTKGLITLNNLIYIILIGLFFYWKFYDVFYSL